MVFPHCVTPRPQPLRQRLYQPGSFIGVPVQNGHVQRRQFTFLVEQFPGDGQLADVMQQRRPVEQVPVVGTEAHFLGDETGITPHPFTVATCPAVMGVHGCGQLEDPGGNVAQRLALSDAGTGLFQAVLQLPSGTRPQGYAPARRHPVGENERQVEQHGHRQHPAGVPVGHDQQGGGGAQQGRPP